MMTPDTVQAPLIALINNLPTIIAAVAAAWVVIWRSNKKTTDTAQATQAVVATSAVVTSQKLDSVHETVNGNFTAEQRKTEAMTAKYEAERIKSQNLEAANAELRRQVSRKSRKRASDA